MEKKVFNQSQALALAKLINDLVVNVVDRPVNQRYPAAITGHHVSKTERDLVNPEKVAGIARMYGDEFLNMPATIYTTFYGDSIESLSWFGARLNEVAFFTLINPVSGECFKITPDLVVENMPALSPLGSRRARNCLGGV